MWRTKASRDFRRARLPATACAAFFPRRGARWTGLGDPSWLWRRRAIPRAAPRHNLWIPSAPTTPPTHTENRCCCYDYRAHCCCGSTRADCRDHCCSTTRPAARTSVLSTALDRGPASSKFSRRRCAPAQREKGKRTKEQRVMEESRYRADDTTNTHRKPMR